MPNHLRRRCSLPAITLAVSLAGPAAAQINFTWQGDNNDNWQNSANWGQDPGAGDVPDDPTHFVFFDDTANRFSVDLNSDTREVGGLEIDATSDSYRFHGGTVHLLGDLDATTGGLTTLFDSDFTMFVPELSIWNGDPGALVFDGELRGLGTVRLASGRVELNAPNRFGGNLQINFGRVVLGDPLALQDAVVHVNFDDGLDLNGYDATIAALRGAADLDLGTQRLTIQGGPPGGLAGYATNHSGTITGDPAGGASLFKDGNETATLTGAIQDLSWIKALKGPMVFTDGADVDLTGPSSTLEVGGGSMEISNGADVTLTGPAPSSATCNIYQNALTIDRGSLTVGRVLSDPLGRVAISDPNDTVALTIGSTGVVGSTSWFDGTLSDAASGPGSVRKVGPLHWTLGNANTFSGSAFIDEGQLNVAHSDALQNATVVVNVNNGLSLTAWGFDANVAALAGPGDLDLGTRSLTISDGRGATHSGAIAGSGQITKNGPGTQTLAGQLAAVGTLRTAAGTLNIGGGAAEVLQAVGGETNVRGALSLAGETANVLHVSGSGAATVENGAVATLIGTGGSNRSVLTQNGTLAVRGTGSALVTPRLDIGPSGAGAAAVSAHSGGTIDAERIRIGDLGGDDGAAGTLSVLAGGSVTADQTVLLRRGTLDIAGGTFVTDRLLDGDSTPHLVTISDPNGGPALTIGIGDGDSVVEALIVDGSAGPGSLRKVGSGTLELRNNNDYTGGTAIDGGTIVLATTELNTAAGYGLVSVNAGGTLAGSGFCVQGIVQAGGVASPGTPAAPVGTLLSVDLTLLPGASTVLDLQGTGDGNVDALLIQNAVLGGALELRYAGGFTASPGDSFLVVDVIGSRTGTFDSVSFPDGQDWFIRYENKSVVVGICADGDGDGVCDPNDVCPGFDDGVDSDGDGVPDGCDLCPGFDDSVDSDGDGIPDGCDTACPGDTDGDGDVDISDLGLLLSQFGQSGTGLGGDVDFDDDVDISDLGLLLARFGTICP